MKTTTKKQQVDAEKADMIKRIKAILGRNKQLYTTVTHVSKSGMSRNIKVFTVKNGEILNISWHVAKLLGWRMAKNESAIVVGGCGMDMCFHTVYTLSSVLYRGKDRAGYILKQHSI